MVQDVSGFGLTINIIASNTFPVGINITQFSDDADPFDLASVQIADRAMGLNGDLVKWSRANPLPVVISVLPGTDDDVNLGILAEANRVGAGKRGARDIITLTGVYPDGSIITYTGGVLTDAMFGKSVSSSSRLKSKVYVFAFENKTGG